MLKILIINSTHIEVILESVLLKTGPLESYNTYNLEDEEDREVHDPTVHLGRIFAADGTTSSAEQARSNQLRKELDVEDQLSIEKGATLTYTRDINHQIPLIQNRAPINQIRYRSPQIYRQVINYQLVEMFSSLHFTLIGSFEKNWAKW